MNSRLLSKPVFFLFLASFLLQSFILSAYPGQVLKSFPLPGQYGTGIAFDGKNIWFADRKTDLLYCINPADGTVIRTLQSPGYWPLALAWDGTSLWNSDLKGGTDISEDYNGVIYKIDPATGQVLQTLDAPSNSPVGLAWDGKYLWCIDDLSDEIIQFSPLDGTTISSFKSPAPDPSGLAFDGKYLWVCDKGNDEIYMVEPSRGRVILIADSPGPYPNGLCFDGKNLWNIDYQEDKLYQLVSSDNATFLRSGERHGKVIFTHQVKNFGPGMVTTADLHIAIPVNRDNQELAGEPGFNMKPTDFVTDRWGQQTAHFHFDNIKAGETKTVEMTTVATTWTVRYFILPDKVGSLAEIPADIKEKYLEDNEKFQLNHPVIQAALAGLGTEEKNPYWIMRNIFDYINANMYYEMTGGWNTAPTVLARGNGSCSEYTFVFISMCRAAGIPARYVGSVVVRGEDASMDDVFHRWAEVYLPGYGWIPVDPSGGDQDWPRSQAAAIGAVRGTLLITTQSGGDSETMGWTYNSNQFWTTDPKTYINFENFADWEVIEF
jgi:transglutaminase-like putative cysteine protease/sugar lactone lactonase YvrE